MPFTAADLPFLIILPLLLMASAFFSGSETALFGLSFKQTQQLTRKPDLTSRLILQLLKDQQYLLITLMVGNMVVNVLYFVICSALLLKIDPKVYHPLWIVAGTFAPLVMIILCGEILPKLLANMLSMHWVRATIIPLYGFHRVVNPVGRRLGKWVISPMRRLLAPREKPGQLGVDELETLIHLSESHGVIGTDEQTLLQEVVNLSQLKVRDVMIPRVDMVAINIESQPHEVFNILQTKRHTRMIVYRGDIDHVEGVLISKEFLLAWRNERTLDWTKLIRQIQFVPEVQRVDQLLESFRKWRAKQAVVVDEYGGTAGMVTLKDVVEELVGDLDMDDGPGESPESSVQQVRSNVWRVSGALSIHDWAEAFGKTAIPPRISTVGGLMTAKLGGIPKPGDRVLLENLEMIVENVHKRRVQSVLLQLAGQENQTDDSSAEQGGAD